MRPSTLHRRLSPDGYPVVGLTVPGGTLLPDSKIREWTATHGGDMYGYTPATMETTAAGSLPARINGSVTVYLSQWLAEKITAGTPIPAARIRPRFVGRVGLDTIDDRGDKRARHTNLRCSSWGALLGQSRRRITMHEGGSLAAETRNIFQHPSLSSMVSLSYGDPAYLDRVHATETGTYQDVADKYTKDIGTLIQQKRDGSLQLLAPNVRRLALEAGNRTQYGYLRSHTLAPASWDQPVESLTGPLSIKRRTADTSVAYVEPWPLPSGVVDALDMDTEPYDWSHIRINSQNYQHFMNARNLESNSPRHSLSSVKFDLMRMVSSPREYDRLCAAQLLDLNAGDPIYFGGDWPKEIRFPYFTTEITETMTPDEWTLEIKTQHPRTVVGMNDPELPVLTSAVWAQAVNPWNTYTKPWK